MSKTLSIFNNKGGVGKTTYMYHVAHLLAQDGLCVLMVDCDSQCNLTAYSLGDTEIDQAWADGGNSIYRAIEPVYRTTGDIRSRAPTKLRSKGELYLVPGDTRLSDFEDRLGDTWNAARGGSEPDLRAQSAIHRYISVAASKVDANLVMVDLGPNLGALNRAVLASSNFFITPVAPDLFSIQGTENLGRKLVSWRKEWDQANAAWDDDELSIPLGRPMYLGYVVQMHNRRSRSPGGMTAGWGIYGQQLEDAVQENIVKKLEPLDQVIEWQDDDYNLGQIPNLHSLIPYSLEARKPVFNCTAEDGLRGAHITSAADSRSHFTQIVDTIKGVVK
jgi:cellulose biosynthesis protein BcsQ